MGKCKDCKFWHIPWYRAKGGIWGSCNEIEKSEWDARLRISNEVDRYIRLEYCEALYVGANFGCIHFERRGE